MLHCTILLQIYESFVDYEIVFRLLCFSDMFEKLIFAIALLNRFIHFVVDTGAHNMKLGVVDLLLSDSYRRISPLNRTSSGKSWETSNGMY